MIVFIVEASHEQWQVSQRWDIGGVFKSFESAKAMVEKNDGAAYNWEKQITQRGAGDWWMAYTHDEWKTMWRIMQLELEG